MRAELQGFAIILNPRHLGRYNATQLYLGSSVLLGDGGGAYVVGNRANNSLSFVNCLVADNIAGGAFATLNALYCIPVMQHLVCPDIPAGYNGGGGLFVRADGGSSTVSFGDCAMTNNAASGCARVCCTVVMRRIMHCGITEGGGVYAEANGVHSGVLFVNCSVLNNTGAR